MTEAPQNINSFEDEHAPAQELNETLSGNTQRHKYKQTTSHGNLLCLFAVVAQVLFGSFILFWISRLTVCGLLLLSLLVL